ncbi:STAS domain-containing protein [Verrucosispora sp. WMMA2044]|uniref:STAS domain-containing protein n=1 Tax=Micromonospora TaxID=1873 RepID=UPI00248CDC4E|nr:MULTISPECIES: STAS domain-containing protein [Micromonospora]WBB51376.1 STAS domain-containing protein [Verrucosispora sp. WMMA2044]
MIRVVGDLAYTTAAPLRAEIDRTMGTDPTTLVLDFGGLQFIDSTGLSVIVHAWREAQQRSVRLRLRAVPRFLETILDMTGVTGLLSREPASTEPDGQTPVTA